MTVRHAPGVVPATDADLAACAREPIHVPGAIQPHGALLAVDEGSLRVTHASANLEEALGRPAAAALGSPLAVVLGAQAVTAILDALATDRFSPGNVLTLDLPVPRDPRRSVLAHRHDRRIVVEIEPASPADDGDLAVARAQAVVGALRSSRSLKSLCDRAAGEIRALTGYDRVMVYRFDADGHGCVIAEDRHPALESYLDLRYPATDIPAQARRLYLLQRVRVIGRVDYAPVPVLADGALGADAPLDMTYAGLRSVSPVHLEYLANMDVGATLAISLVEDDRLWGMVVCHHRSPRVPTPELRALADLVGQLLGLLVGEVEEREARRDESERRDLVAVVEATLKDASSVLDGLAAAGPSLLRLVEAGGAFLRFGGRTIAVGATPPLEAADALFRAAMGTLGEEVAAIESLAERAPALAAHAALASGALALPVAHNPGDGILWFRPELARTVRWGGDPGRKSEIERETGRITPRKSFAAWSEILRGRCRPWTPTDRRIALECRRVVVRALLRQAETELMRMAVVDPLTGLPNRRALDDRLACWRATTPRPGAALLFCDLDRFKTVNDSLGHAAGDELLVQVADRLRGLVGPRQAAARLGGDEFAVFCEDADGTAALALAARVLSSFDEPLVIEGRPHRAGVSIGIACAGSTPEGDLLREADAAMYAAKRAGGNRAVVFRPELGATVSRTLRMEQDLFGALERGEMALFYQPIVSLPGARIVGFEGLLRWRHPELGFVSPAEFIPVAEETGLINRIGRWAVEEGVGELARWPMGVRLSLNVSPRQLLDGGLPEHVTDTLRRRGVGAERLILEVTEGTLMEQRAVHELARLREAGLRIAVDDFGTGYSSLAYLQRLPIDVIKIDRAFVTPLDDDERAARFVAMLIGLAHSLDLGIVAEGVETPAQLAALQQAGCDHAQGFLFSRPVPVEAIEGLLGAA